jgi:hypothetical protein
MTAWTREHRDDSGGIFVVTVSDFPGGPTISVLAETKSWAKYLAEFDESTAKAEADRLVAIEANHRCMGRCSEWSVADTAAPQGL